MKRTRPSSSTATARVPASTCSRITQRVRVSRTQVNNASASISANAGIPRARAWIKAKASSGLTRYWSVLACCMSALLSGGLLAGKVLPPLDGDVHIGGLLLHGVADPPGALGGDELGTRATEGFVDDVARLGV